MTIPPKSVRVVYKGVEGKVTYVPELKKWKWEFVMIHRLTFCDYVESEKEATLTVKKEIDRYLTSQEKAVTRGVSRRETLKEAK